jgi:hypothetical protein
LVLLMRVRWTIERLLPWHSSQLQSGQFSHTATGSSSPSQSHLDPRLSICSGCT